jgi:hypothetical protein
VIEKVVQQRLLVLESALVLRRGRTDAQVREHPDQGGRVGGLEQGAGNRASDARQRGGVARKNDHGDPRERHIIPHPVYELLPTIRTGQHEIQHNRTRAEATREDAVDLHQRMRSTDLQNALKQQDVFEALQRVFVVLDQEHALASA